MECHRFSITIGTPIDPRLFRGFLSHSGQVPNPVSFAELLNSVDSLGTGFPCPVLQEKRPGRDADLPLVPQLKMGGALPLLLICLRGVHRNRLTFVCL
jgi:hypothetical protein